jgi:hypothetical protein
MPRRIMLAVFFAVFALALDAATATAADLPAQSQIGAIFAEPAEVRVAPIPPRDLGYAAPIIGYNLLPVPVWARGGYYYGSPWMYFDSGPYYGGPYSPSFIRLPYVCGLYGYC